MDMGNITKIAAVAVLLSPSIAFAQWKITPSVNAEETYTDNVTLTSQSLAKSDFVTSIMPSISVAETGHYLTAERNLFATRAYLCGS